MEKRPEARRDADVVLAHGTVSNLPSATDRTKGEEA